MFRGLCDLFSFIYLFAFLGIYIHTALSFYVKLESAAVTDLILKSNAPACSSCPKKLSNTVKVSPEWSL